MITSIDIARITPHPNNPRKQLGDLSELSESIKAKGILQNLTVVPADIEAYKKAKQTKHAYNGEYITIIGHRRTAAAELAGLSEAPCVVCEMTEEEQIETMLLENMQRSDLTVYEQAEGFQYMMDLGKSVEEISQSTGFSKSTVRSRVKLLSLDREKFAKSVERGGTLLDFIELDRIKDPELKNEVLEHIGTANFKMKLEQAVLSEKRLENKEKLIAALNEFATEIEDGSGKRYVRFISFDNDSMDEPEDADEVEYFYQVYASGVYLYKEPTESKIDPAKEEQRRKLEELRDKLDSLSQQAYKLRYDFVKSFSATKAHFNTIAEFAVHAITVGGLGYMDKQNLEELLGADFGNDLTFEKIAEKTKENPSYMLLAMAWCSLDGTNCCYRVYDCKHTENKGLDAVYGYLERLGYKMSDDERQLQNGTHELFKK